MRLTPMEYLRRAAVRAHRAAEVAHTAAWRATRTMYNLKAAAGDVAQGTMAAPIRAFLDAEAERQRAASFEAEGAAYTRLREASDLTDLLGARVAAPRGTRRTR